MARVPGRVFPNGTPGLAASRSALLALHRPRCRAGDCARPAAPPACGSAPDAGHSRRRSCPAERCAALAGLALRVAAPPFATRLTSAPPLRARRGGAPRRLAVKKRGERRTPAAPPLAASARPLLAVGVNAGLGPGRGIHALCPRRRRLPRGLIGRRALGPLGGSVALRDSLPGCRAPLGLPVARGPRRLRLELVDLGLGGDECVLSTKFEQNGHRELSSVRTSGAHAF